MSERANIEQEIDSHKSVYGDPPTRFFDNFDGWLPGGFMLRAVENSVNLDKRIFNEGNSEKYKLLTVREFIAEVDSATKAADHSAEDIIESRKRHKDNPSALGAKQEYFQIRKDIYIELRLRGFNS